MRKYILYISLVICHVSLSLLFVSCEKEANAPALNRAASVDGQEGYKSRLLAPAGFERGVGYTYATGADYLEGVGFNIFNLNYLDSIQYVKGLNFVSDDYRLSPARHAVPYPSSWHCRQASVSTSSLPTSMCQVITPRAL